MTWISIHCQVLLIRSWLNDLIVNCMVSNVLYRVVFVFHSRLSGEEGRQFLPAVEKHFSRLGKAILTHITGPNPELSQAALQALGFCVYHAHVVSGVSENFASEILSALCSLVVSSTDKNSCTRALWVISKQSFPSEVVAKKVDPLLEMLERVMSRRDIQSLVMEHEALNVVIRLLEQAPVQMGVAAVRWSKLVIPMVVHSASKVRLRAAAAMELGLPLLLERQNEVAAVIEPLMPTILVPELQKLFASKNEVNVLKLWPLFVKLLGKHLHRGGPFINSLLHLEELGFRSSSPNVKKIAFIAWKSLIDNFALNPEILCSAKRMKLLLQPLLSIHVRTEALQLSRLEVWWYLVVRLGPNLGPHFEQVSIPLLQCTIRADSSTSTLQAGTPVRGAGQNSTLGNPTCFNSPANTPRLNLSLSQQAGQSFPPIQLLGLEMLLHYFLGPEVVPAAARVNLQLTLEPLTHSFLSGGSTFSKHAALLISSVTHGFISVGADAPDPLLVLIWRSLVSLVSSTVDSGNKKERQGSEVLTLMLQALQTIAASEALPPSRVLVLLEITVKAIHPRVLGSAAYQVGKMDVLNGTPALFLILLLYNSDKLSTYAEDERFFQCLNTLVGCGLAGPTSSLAFVEAVLGAAARRASFVPSKEHLWRMWSAVVTPLTDAITQSNEVNQGDALEHDFSAVHSSLMFPVRHLLLVDPLPQMTQKSLLSTWSKLYRVFARCSALVLTAEENVSCEELCVRMAAFLNVDTLARPATLDAVSGMLQVMVECVDFSPYTPTFQQKTKSPCTPVNWTRKRSQALGNLAAFQALLIQALEAFLVAAGPSDSTGLALASVLSTLFNSLAQATPLRVALGSLAPHLAVLYRRAAATTTTSETPAFSSQLVTKVGVLSLEKLLVELLGHLQSRSTLDYDDQLLLYLAPLLCVAFPHKNKALRTQATHFWNATFAKASSLAYPEELKPVLSQVKRKTPIILPGFEAVAVSDEHSGPYSSDCSQLDTKLSGVQMPSAGKRDSLLGRAAELKDQSAKSLAKPVSTKLDFGSPKPPPRGVLEEEASIDFVFIPPENKERVLTEHQKEVKRTKRGDLPAMYNNLDASLDTTAFTQYTQSQEDSTLVHANRTNVDEMEVEGESDLLYKDTEDYTSPGAAKNKDPAVVEQEGGVIPDSADVSMQDAQENPEPNEGASADVSGGSDLVSGTPPKPNSRRQSFITLEKYVEGQAASPIQVTKFTGRLTRPAKDKASPAQADISSPSRDEPMASEISSPSRDEPKLSEIYSPSRDDPTLSETSSPSGAAAPDEAAPDEAAPEAAAPDEAAPEAAAPDEAAPEAAAPDEAAPEAAAPDEAAPEAAAPDEAAPEAAAPDEAAPDEAAPDEAAPDEAAPDEAAPDEAAPDEASAEAPAAPETSTYKVVTPETIVSEEATPETSAPETSAPETAAPETAAPETAAPETAAPETAAPETAAPETAAPETTAPKDGTPEATSEAPAAPEEATTVAPAASQAPAAPETAALPSQTDRQPKPRRSELSLLIEGLSGSSTDEDKRRAGAANSISQEDSQALTLSSSGSQLQNRLRRRGKASAQSLEAAEKSQNLTESELDAEAQASPSAVRTRTRSSFPHGEQVSQTIFSSLDKAALAARKPNSGRGKYPRRRSSQALLANNENSESESSETRESPPSKKKISYHKAPLVPSPLTVQSAAMDDASETSQSDPSQGTPTISPSKTKSLLQSQKEALISLSRVPLVFTELEQQCEVGVIPIVALEQVPEKAGTENTNPIAPNTDLKCKLSLIAPSEEDCEQRLSQAKLDPSDQVPLDCESTDTITERSQEVLLPPVSAAPTSATNASSNEDEDDGDDEVFTDATDLSSAPADHRSTPAASGEATANQSSSASGSSEEKVQHVAQPAQEEVIAEVPQANSSEPSGVPADGKGCEDAASTPAKQDEGAPQKALDILVVEQEVGQISSREDPAGLAEATTSVQDEVRAAQAILCPQVAEEEPTTSSLWNSTHAAKEDNHSSPAKRLTPEVGLGLEVAQSPSGRTRGTWSPSASPSSSILKKAQKRALEEDAAISPLVKSRRVSFANPIQHQELADDIDRRSPVVRTSSPKRIDRVLQYVTTPTKGLLVLSPRNLHSSGYKSSKKCLMSEMSQEPRAIPKDCVFPSLVCCSAPIEAVLPLISTNMWPRGFGQLVRAKNIRTVGDLSSLKPLDIKTLPIRSPKITNVKKALQLYEAQMRGFGDELKSFEEMEKMMSSSEPEETNTSLNQEEDGKTPHETLGESRLLCGRLSE
uniref:Replication timing regulatory factor 1 n=1 Tax=Gadus morhua TaxID=8049 RepID=A0A8C5ADR4_GADMO